MQKLVHRNGMAALALRLGFGLGAALFPLAVLQAAEGDVVLDDLVFTLGASTYRIPHLELKGATLPPAELSALFTGDEKTIDARLARLSARSLTVPSLIVESRAGATVERSDYRDVVAQDVANGRIALARAAGAEQTVEKPEGGSGRYLWGASVAKGIDLRQFVHLALAAVPDPVEAIKPLIDEESVESLSFEEKGERFSVRTGRLAVSGVKGRASAVRLSQLLERLDKPAPDPTTLGDLVGALAAFEAAALEARDVTASGKGEPAEKPYVIRIGRVSAKKIADAALGDVAADDFSLVSSDGGKIALKHFALRDAQLSSLVDAPYPRLGRIEMKGLDADLPDARLGEPARMKFRLDGGEAEFANYREIAPTKFSMRMDRLAIDLAARGEAPSTAQFIALGYRDLEFSAAFAGEWREKTQEAVFSPIHVQGKDMGAATLGATFGNVSSAVFSPMTIVSRAAALAASLKAVDLTVEGGGLLDRILAAEAKAAKTPLEKARADYAKAAGDAVAALGGGGEKARRIGDAVAAYVLAPKRLHLRLDAGKGINALDAFAKKPGDLLESVEVEATVER